LQRAVHFYITLTSKLRIWINKQAAKERKLQVPIEYQACQALSSRHSELALFGIHAAGSLKSFDWSKSAIEIIAQSTTAERFRPTISLAKRTPWISRTIAADQLTITIYDEDKRNNLSNYNVRNKEIHMNRYYSFQSRK